MKTTPTSPAHALELLDKAESSVLSLTTERDNLKASLGTESAALVSVRAELATANSSLATIRTEKATVDSALATANANLATVTAERDTLKSEKVTQEKAVAQELAKHGITPKVVNTPAPGTDTKAGAAGEALLAEYQSVANDPKALSALLNDPEKGPKLRKLVA